MAPMSFASLRVRLFLLVFLAVVPALGAILYTAAEEHQLARAEVQESTLRLVRLAAAEQGRFLQSTHQLLAALAHSRVVRDREETACSALLAEFLARYSLYADLSVSMSNGDVFCSALPASRSLNLSTFSWFHRTAQSRDFTIGEYQPDPVSNKFVLVVSYPVLNDTGDPLGVVAASLDLTWLSQTITQASLPVGSTLTAIDRKGTVILHYPDPEKWVGQNYLHAPIVQTMLTQDEGISEILGLDETPRLHAFTPVKGLPDVGMYISIGIPTAIAFADVRSRLVRNLVLWSAVVSLALVASWLGGDLLILHSVKRLTAMAERLSMGELSVRAGPPYGEGELDQLARTFDNMAGALEQREQERRRIDEEIHTPNAELEQRVIERTAQLEAVNKELESFSYSVSHDLRAPLRHLDGFARLLLKREGIGADATSAHYVQVIADAAAQMSRLIDDLLAFSRTGRLELKIQRVEIDQLIQEVVEELAPIMKDRRITWSVGALPAVEADPALLRLVWVNLLENAIKFTAPRPAAHIEIGSGAAENGMVTIFVRDNGVGFDNAYAHKLFGMFQRLHGDSEFPGTGIGLVNVQRIIQRHGGRVWAKGEKDRGATFYFTLKKSPAESRASEEEVAR